MSSQQSNGQFERTADQWSSNLESMFSASVILNSTGSDKAMDSCFSSVSLLSLSVVVDKVVLDEALASFGFEEAFVDFLTFRLLDVSMP